MDGFTPLLLDVWRAACRHIELNESVEEIAPRLAARLPADAVLVRRFVPAQRVVETAGQAACRPGAPLPRPARLELTQAEMDALLGWGRGRSVLCATARRAQDVAPGLLPPRSRGSLLAGPLHQDGTVVGALVLLRSSGGGFATEHEALLAALLEPFAVAMENDRRLHELRVLREAVEADNRSLLHRLGRREIGDTIVGAAAGLAAVMQRVELVAPSDAPVLLLGETGSGKEVIARAVHHRSPRAAGPFLRVNCGAIPSELIDSQLFGHEKGSFTGAVDQRRGWFERADGGTLFLDEVGELPTHAQVRLLRVLQDGCFERVGGEKPLHVDVRIVAATNRDLRAMVRQGQFREDLWYRIAVFPIDIPPLRQRPEDLPALAAHFALRAARRLGTMPVTPSPEDHRLLRSYDWPGNVRELATVIERAVILGNGKGLALAAALGQSSPSPRGGAPAPPSKPNSPTTPPAPDADATLRDAIAHHITRALQQCLGRVEGPFGAAALLGVNPSTLRSRMRKLGISARAFRNPAGRP